MAKKKVEKKSNENKKRIWLIINFAVIMAFGVLIAVQSEVVGIAYVGSKSIVDPEAEEASFRLTKDIIMEANRVMNKSILISVGTYGLVQLINYVAFTFKKKKVLIGFVLAELILGTVGYFINGDLIMFGFPLLSSLIYLRVLKLEEV